MTSNSSRPIVCECGHTGSVDLSENDQPFSGLWESYSLHGFSGRDFTITSFKDMPPDVLAYMKPKCPKCGSVGKVKYAQGS
jgi:hypothetical protein